MSLNAMNKTLQAVRLERIERALEHTPAGTLRARAVAMLGNERCVACEIEQTLGTPAASHHTCGR